MTKIPAHLKAYRKADRRRKNMYKEYWQSTDDHKRRAHAVYQWKATYFADEAQWRQFRQWLKGWTCP